MLQEFTFPQSSTNMHAFSTRLFRTRDWGARTIPSPSVRLTVLFCTRAWLAPLRLMAASAVQFQPESCTVTCCTVLPLPATWIPLRPACCTDPPSIRLPLPETSTPPRYCGEIS